MFSKGFVKTSNRFIAAALAPAAGALVGNVAHGLLRKKKKGEDAQKVKENKETAKALGSLAGVGVSGLLLRKELKRIEGSVSHPTKPSAAHHKLPLKASSYNTYKRTGHPAVKSRRKNVIKVDFKKPGFMKSVSRFVRKF